MHGHTNIKYIDIKSNNIGAVHTQQLFFSSISYRLLNDKIISTKQESI